MITATEQKQQENEQKKLGFAEWMEQPATRMMLSMIPSTENAEVLRTLLQETFNSGFNKGAGTVAVGFLDAMIKSMDRKRD